MGTVSRTGKVIYHTAQSLQWLACLYVIAILICAEAFSVAEGKSFADSVWWAFVTAMTTGYGDFYPVTLVGRVAGVFLMHVVPLIAVPLITAKIASRLIVDSDAFTHHEQEEIKERLRSIEALLRERSGQ